MIIKSNDAEMAAVLAAANQMCAAARTAPKTCGVDKVLTKILTGDDIEKIAVKMEEIGAAVNRPFFARNAESIRSGLAIVLIGIKRHYYALNCGYCGHENCAACKEAGTLCLFAPTDLGIAMGSAVAMAADMRIDNRIMYSIGRAIEVMPEYNDGEDAIWMGIPLSVTGKSPFFDRK